MIKIVLVISLLAGLCSCSKTDDTGLKEVTVPEPTGNFEFSVLKVGQADAIILHTENHTVVIDCGEEDDGDEVVKNLKEKGAESVDYLFVTHFDKDHVGGVPEVLNSFEADKIITPDYKGTNDEYAQYAKTIEEKGYSPLKLTEDMSFVLDDVLFEVYAPQRTSYAEGDNDFSIAIGITHGENRFLFTGDAEEQRLTEILSRVSGEYNLLKVPHHGKYNKKTKGFIQTIKPEYSIITCSDKNPPEQETVKVLESMNSKVYYTKDGDVEVLSDGENIEISQ